MSKNIFAGFTSLFTWVVLMVLSLMYKSINLWAVATTFGMAGLVVLLVNAIKENQKALKAKTAQ